MNFLEFLAGVFHAAPTEWGADRRSRIAILVVALGVMGVALVVLLVVS